jgi:hypothetical protein
MSSIPHAFVFVHYLFFAVVVLAPKGGATSVDAHTPLEGRAALAARGNETIGIVPEPRHPETPSPSVSGPAVAYLPAPGASDPSQPVSPGLVQAFVDASPPVVSGSALDASIVPVAPDALAEEAAARVTPEAPVPDAALVSPSASEALVAEVLSGVAPASIPAGWIEPPLPRADLLTIPGPDGMITLGAEPISAERAQNPFDIRFVAAGAAPDRVLDLRSLVLRAGQPEAGKAEDRSVAFLNGRPLMRGDRVEGLFTLDSIRLREIILERAGRFYLVPAGRVTTVRLAN